MSLDRAGVVLVDKPAGPSSAELVDWIRWTLRGPAVGHCGTLDPAATGLLVVCIGAATKLAAVLTDADKRYAATFVLGRSTTTGDAQGDTVVEANVDAHAVERAAVELPRMVGELTLAPPSFSAVKVEGKRAHELAREGAAPELAPRVMTVRRVDAVTRDATSVAAELTVSKGTYIRSLAEELGRRIGVPAHLGALRRLASGHLDVADPRTLAGFDVVPRDRDRSGKPRHRIRLHGVAHDRDAQADAIASAVVDPLEALPLPRIELDDSEAGRDCIRRLLHGQPVGTSHPAIAASHSAIGAPGAGAVAVVAAGALVLAIWDESGDTVLLRPTRVVVAP